MMNDTELRIKLDTVIDKLNHIEALLYGDGDREGVRIDVDRLKQAHETHRKVLWAFFTALIGLVVAYVSSFFN